ncbi:MAG: carbonic anhydrase family protein [Myxococcales bacterium]|nr:carbonic anhydrase family protein [Myxococcales bacterium]
MGCDSDDSSDAHDGGGAHEIHWGYEAENGPAKWATLSPDYALCADGQEQSPIDLTGATAVDPIGLTPAWQASAASVVDNGHTVQINLDSGGTLTLDGTTYTLRQFHLHAPSEHTVESHAAPLEVHLVHSTDDGHLAVVGVLLEEGAADPTLAAVFAHLPEMENEPVALPDPIDASALLPADHSAWRYAGSLTTPPCSEGVRWTVLKTPMHASAEQISAFRNLHAGNARPAQPINSRTLTLDAPPG